MKTPYSVLLASSVLLLAGCGKGSDQTAAGAAPAPAVASGPQTLTLSANDTMKYSLTRLEVPAGQEVTLTFTNAGAMPKAQMAHNWILLKAGSDATAFANAGVTHKADDYFPTELADEVIAHTKLLGPKQSDTITFKAPTAPGEYTYLCTFPGHFVSGMHGVLVVH
ncbi:MAG TPA: azurin [Opitutaceae bacterium]|nr:azurin [Opitutaceae bacterium]